MTIDIESTNGDQRWSIMIHLSLKLKPLRPLSVGPHISDRDVECVSRVRPGSDASHPKTNARLALKRCISMFQVIHTNHPPPLPTQKKKTQSLNHTLLVVDMTFGRYFWISPPRPLLVADTCPQVTLATTLNLSFSPPKTSKTEIASIERWRISKTIRAKIPDVNHPISLDFSWGNFWPPTKFTQLPNRFPALRPWHIPSRYRHTSP